jgi:hypothetical protein
LYVHEFGFRIGLRLLHVQVKPLSKEVRNKSDFLKQEAQS